MEKDSSDDENDDEDGLPFIPFSRNDKLSRIRVVWVNSIIVKPYGKAISNSWLEYKAKSLWKLVVT